MTDEVKLNQPTHHKQKKSAKPKQTETPLADAWKFGSFVVRAAIAAATGKLYGNSAVDEAMGEAFASIKPPQEVCDQGKHYDILINGMAGAWKAARGDEEWE